MYHYVYRITNKTINKHYYGVRTSKKQPKTDLGHNYFSSSTDKEFIKEQKSNPSIFKYKVIKTFDNRDEATQYEVLLHERFNVAVNESFYNRSRQTSTGFDRAGVKLTEEHKQKIKVNHRGGPTGYTTVIDSNGIRKQVRTDDYMYTSGLLQHFNKGYIKVMQDGICITIKKGDFNPDVHTTIFKGLVIAKDSSGNTVRVSKDEFNRGNYTAISKGMVNVIDPDTGKKTRVHKDLFRQGNYLSMRSSIFKIYDNNHILQHTIQSNFTNYCKEHKLPYGQFITSYKNGGTPIYEVMTKTLLTQCQNNGYIKYVGWYCKKT